MAGICRVAAAAAAARSVARRIGSSPPHRRSFGAAVAYDSEWEEEVDEEDNVRRRGSVAHDSEWREMEGRGVQWVFLGAQKRVYATRVAELLGVPYISMGTLVRQELHPRSSIYLKIANAVNEGRLVPEDIIFGLLTKRLEEGYLQGETGFILDGIPRNQIQAEILDQIVDIDLVVNFKCTDDCLVKKHFGGDICSHCGKAFDANVSESTSLNPCLATRTRHTQLKSSSSTDVEETHMEKIRIFSEQSKQLEEYYRNRNKLLDFQVSSSGPPSETWRGLLAALRLQHMDASLKLTI